MSDWIFDLANHFQTRNSAKILHKLNFNTVETELLSNLDKINIDRLD